MRRAVKKIVAVVLNGLLLIAFVSAGSVSADIDFVRNGGSLVSSDCLENSPVDSDVSWGIEGSDHTPRLNEDVDGSIENIFVDFAGERVALDFHDDNIASVIVPTTVVNVGIYTLKAIQNACADVDGVKIGNDYTNHYFVRELTGDTTKLNVTIGCGNGEKTYVINVIKRDIPEVKYIKLATVSYNGSRHIVTFDKDYRAAVTVPAGVRKVDLEITAQDSDDTVSITKFGKTVGSTLELYRGRNTYVIGVRGQKHILRVNRGIENTEDALGTLGFTVVSKGTFSNKGAAEYVEGMKIMANVCHKYGVPVTWIVQSTTVRNFPELFTEWHEKYGDEIAVLAPGTVQNLEQEIIKIKEVCPWADIKMADFSNQPAFSEADWQKMKELGITSTWGVCYMQSYTDGISSEGAPWGMYNADREMSKIPAGDKSGITRVEWSNRDLNLAYRTSWPEYFSFVPYDSYTPNVILFDDITYWTNDIEQYRRNIEFNKLVPVVIEEEYDLLDPEHTFLTERNKASLLKSMETLFEYLRDKNDLITNASDLVEKYNKANGGITPPTYAFFDNIASQTPLIAYRDYFGHRDAVEGQELFGRPRTFPTKEILGYPDAFIYYDENSMSFFDKGDPQPKRIYDYTKVTPENVNAHVLPRSEDKGTVTVKKIKTDSGYRFDIVVTATERIPYGVALWGDYLEYDISCNARFSAKTLGSEMIYVPMIAQQGETRFSVYVTEKSVDD